jgi:O-antigen ligase
MAGFGGNPDYFNLFNIIFIMYSYTHINERKNKILFFLSLSNTLLTFSMSAFGSILIVLLIDFIFLNNLKERINKLFLLMVIVTLILVLLFSYIDIEYILNIIEARTNHLESGSGRFEMWRFAFQIISENIWHGISINNLRVLTQENFDIINIHSTYLEIFVESGILIFFLFISFQMLILFNLFKVYKNDKMTKYIFLAIFSYFVNMLFVSALIHESFLFLLLVAFSIINKNLNLQKKEKNEKK